MDATVVLSMAKWIMAELVRVFHDTTTAEATAVVESLTERSIPILWTVGDRTRVLSPSLGTREKMLVLLFGSISPLQVRKVIEWLEYGNASRFRSKILLPAHRDDLVHHDNAHDTLQLTPLGTQFVERNLPLELGG
jgi:hypothetical protein